MSTVKPASQAEAAAPFKSSLPIELIPTDLAKIVSQAHPALLLSLFYFRFSALVADPVPTLLSSLLPLTVIQIGYTVICIPAVGSNVKGVKKTKGTPGKKVSFAEPPPANASAQGFTVFIALLLTTLSIPLLTALQVLFGAPISTHIPHTLLSSAHLAFLAIYPLIYAHGSDGKKWREIASLYSPMDEVFGGALGGFIGAWLGAVPIPLDWDREWQKWPVTIVSGVYAGYVVGKWLGGWALRGRRIEFD
ncbi:GPI biosynthesis protein Pig-F [Halenospora varia]|nr:GPI biosynthesis protein Pig-F [Halenospora varia]